MRADDEQKLSDIIALLGETRARMLGMVFSEDGIVPVVHEILADIKEGEQHLTHILDNARDDEVDEGEGLEDSVDPRSFATLRVDHILDRGRVKWNGPAKSREKKGVCFHHIGVYPGMSAPKNVPDSWPDKVRKDGTEHPLIDEMVRLCYRIAGQGRYKGLSYHGGSIRGGLVVNLPFRLRTWHGDGANSDYAGYFFNYHSGKGALYDPYPMEIEKACRFIALMRDEGHPVEEITVHGAWSRKPLDPGAEVIERVLVPVAERMGMEIDWNWKAALSYTSMEEMVNQ